MNIYHSNKITMKISAPEVMVVENKKPKYYFEDMLSLCSVDHIP